MAAYEDFAVWVDSADGSADLVCEQCRPVALVRDASGATLRDLLEAAEAHAGRAHG